MAQKKNSKKNKPKVVKINFMYLQMDKNITFFLKTIGELLETFFQNH